MTDTYQGPSNACLSLSGKMKHLLWTEAWTCVGLRLGILMLRTSPSVENEGKNEDEISRDKGQARDTLQNV